MASPCWTYDEEYYDRPEAAPFEIRTHPIKGKGLYARRDYKEGDVILKERALVCAQNLDEAGKVPVCDCCLLSLETPRGLMERTTNNDCTALKLFDAFVSKQPDCQPPSTPQFRCPHCPTLYCSEACRKDAWVKHHAMLCIGGKPEVAVSAWQTFLRRDWTNGGVDYSDTHGVAIRLIAQVIAEHRLNGVPLELAWRGPSQLIRAPLSAFTFSFLIQDWTKDENEPVDWTKRWADFKRYRDRPHDNPIVIKARQDSECPLPVMLETGLMLLRAIFQMTPEEEGFFTKDLWSELLGSVLLNGQERSPHSPYATYMYQARGKDKEATRNLTLALREKGIDTKKLKQSTHGQAIYRIGCLFNHSCDPNMHILYDDEKNNETLVAYAKRDIKAGEELCISYIEESMCFYERQQQLREHYLFNCLCPVCQREGKELNEIE